MKKFNNIKTLKFLIPYTMQYKKQLICAIIALIIATFTTLTIPIAIRIMLDSGLDTILNTPPTNQNPFFLLAILGILLALASATRYYFVIWIGEKIIQDIRNDTFKHITTLSANFFDKNKTAELISHLTNDTTLIKSIASATASTAIRNSMLMFGAIIAMFYTNIFLTLIAFATMPFIILPIIILGKAVRSKTQTAQEQLGKTANTALEAISGIKIIQAFKQEKQINEKFQNNTQKTFQSAKQSFSLRALLVFVAILTTFAAIICIMAIGIQQVKQNNITPGLFGQFIVYAILCAAAIISISEVWGELSQAAAATQRIANIKKQKINIKTKKPIIKIRKKIKGTIKFQNVQFIYPNKQKIILDNININIKQGQHIYIIGESGAGKTTLFNILTRQYNPTKGNIKIDGYNIENIKPADLRQHITIVPQENVIFADTIYNNILFAKPTATKQQIHQAAKLALVDSFAKNLPNALQTKISERGNNLSGGQKQRIMIARAMLCNAPILLLDEATGSLDAKNEKLIQQAINNLRQGKTTISITHRLANAKNADTIYIIDKGKIIEHGTHQKLLKNNGYYAKMIKKTLAKQKNKR